MPVYRNFIPKITRETDTTTASILARGVVLPLQYSFLVASKGGLSRSGVLLIVSSCNLHQSSLPGVRMSKFAVEVEANTAKTTDDNANAKTIERVNSILILHQIKYNWVTNKEVKIFFN